MLEASIFRKRLLNIGRQPALQRVAHLLCEQLARREAVGINVATIPLSQMDLADAVGLSIVHVSRTFQELRRLNILSKQGRTINVVDRKRLVILASFDGNYLNMPQLLAHWHVKMDCVSTPAKRPAAGDPPTSAPGLCSKSTEHREWSTQVTPEGFGRRKHRSAMTGLGA